MDNKFSNEKTRLQVSILDDGEVPSADIDLIRLSKNNESLRSDEELQTALYEIEENVLDESRPMLFRIDDGRRFVAYPTEVFDKMSNHLSLIQEDGRLLSKKTKAVNSIDELLSDPDVFEKLFNNGLSSGTVILKIQKGLSPGIVIFDEELHNQLQRKIYNIPEKQTEDNPLVAFARECARCEFDKRPLVEKEEETVSQQDDTKAVVADNDDTSTGFLGALEDITDAAGDVGRSLLSAVATNTAAQEKKRRKKRGTKSVSQNISDISFTDAQVDLFRSRSNTVISAFVEGYPADGTGHNFINKIIEQSDLAPSAKADLAAEALAGMTNSTQRNVGNESVARNYMQVLSFVFNKIIIDSQSNKFDDIDLDKILEPAALQKIIENLELRMLPLTTKRGGRLAARDLFLLSEVSLSRVDQLELLKSDITDQASCESKDLCKSWVEKIDSTIEDLYDIADFEQKLKVSEFNDRVRRVIEHKETYDSISQRFSKYAYEQKEENKKREKEKEEQSEKIKITTIEGLLKKSTENKKKLILEGHSYSAEFPGKDKTERQHNIIFNKKVAHYLNNIQLSKYDDFLKAILKGFSVRTKTGIHIAPGKKNEISVKASVGKGKFYLYGSIEGTTITLSGHE